MRYLKVILFVVFFFVSMIFFFQNQAVLSTDMTLNLNLFFTEPMQSIPLPFYFLVLAAFFTGALLAVLSLIWDKMNISARLMKATWRVRSLEKEVATLRANQAKALPITPQTPVHTVTVASESAEVKLEKDAAEHIEDVKGTQVKDQETEEQVKEEQVETEAEAKAPEIVEDVKAPDPNKGA